MQVFIFAHSNHAVLMIQVKSLLQMSQLSSDQLMGTTNGIGGMTGMLFFMLLAPRKTMTVSM